MTGTTERSSRVGTGVAFGSLDAETADRIDVHLQRASAADDRAKKDFHIRHAQQLLEGVKESA